MAKKRKIQSLTSDSAVEPEAGALPVPAQRPNKKVKSAGPKAKVIKVEKSNGAAEQPVVANKGDAPQVFHNKEKVLVLTSRGINYRFRHLVTDLQLLLPHSKKDAKLENTKENRAVLLNEAAELKNCSSCLFFEGRKKQDLYMWMSKTPNGPSAKFLVSAVHTMAELKLTGNHLKGSRPIVTFSPGFDQHPHLQLLKEMFIQVFSTPHQHRKSKPFFDHVMAFSLLDKHVWVRNYQIVVPHHGTAKLEKGALDKTTLVEVGPRFCLNPIKVFAGSFGGATLFENPFYVSPNTVRANIKRAKAGKYASKVKAKQRRKQHQGAFPAEADEFADLWKQGDDAGDDIDE